jgi:hypothetical protein
MQFSTAIFESAFRRVEQLVKPIQSDFIAFSGTVLTLMKIGSVRG